MSGRRQQRGFTLVELMIVVAIVGVLVALGIYGVQRYLSASKSAEAKNNLGAISRAAVAAYERTSGDGEIIAAGKEASKEEHALCKNSNWVPKKIQRDKKYQPNTAKGDFQAGNDKAGWRCLKFEINEPIIYMYQYRYKSGDWSGQAKKSGAKEYYVARAQGDVDGDKIMSRFILAGVVRNKKIVTSSSVWILREDE